MSDPKFTTEQIKKALLNAKVDEITSAKFLDRLVKPRKRITIDVVVNDDKIDSWGQRSWAQVLMGAATKDRVAGPLYYRNVCDSDWSKFFNVDFDSITVEDIE